MSFLLLKKLVCHLKYTMSQKIPVYFETLYLSHFLE